MTDNPYAAPSLANADTTDRTRVPPGLTLPEMFALLAFGVAGSASLGVLTNAINGAISPKYFQRVMNWNGQTDVWSRAIGQGAFEGVVYGFGYSAIFLALICGLSNGRCRLRVALRYARFVLLGSLGCWLVGGAISVGCSLLWPQDLIFWRYQLVDHVCYAWVKGSILGIVYGGLGCVLLASCVYAWRQGCSSALGSAT